MIDLENHDNPSSIIRATIARSQISLDNYGCKLQVLIGAFTAIKYLLINSRKPKMTANQGL